VLEVLQHLAVEKMELALLELIQFLVQLHQQVVVVEVLVVAHQEEVKDLMVDLVVVLEVEIIVQADRVIHLRLVHLKEVQEEILLQVLILQV
jgi:hypothetical protein